MMLGEGLPLMHGLPEPRRLALISSTAYADGAVTQVLRPPRAVRLPRTKGEPF